MRMLWMIISLAILVSLASFFVTAAPAYAALPPLDEADLGRDARYIVVGQVKTVSRTEVSIEEGTNYEYVAVVEVLGVEKGLLMSSDPDQVVSQPLGTPTPGDTIEVYYWQSGERPFGWTGDGGQYNSLNPDTQVRLYLREGEENRLYLLEPNGWELLSPE